MVNKRPACKRMLPLVEEHLQYLRDEGQNPSRGRVSVLTRFAQAYDAEGKWASALDADWTSRQLRKLCAGKAQNTKRSYIGHVTKFAKWGKFERYWDLDTDHIRAGKTTMERARPPRYFDGQWLREFWEAQSEAPSGWYFRALIAFCCMTLIRGSSEVVTIRLRDLDLDNRTCGVVRHKTDGGTRDEIVLTRHLCHELRMYLAKYREVYGQPLRGDMYLFPRFKTNGSPDHQGVLWPYVQRYDLWNTVKERIIKRLPPHEQKDPECTATLGSHTLRRSYARAKYNLLVDKVGMDKAIGIVQGDLGHQDPKTTLIYIGMSQITAARNKANVDFEFFDDWQNEPTEASVIPFPSAG